jgi:hypothetical protein
MTDLVKRLRDLGDHASFEPHMHHTAADRIEELEAENARLWEALAEAVYMIAPEAEDILKGAGIYRIVLAYRLSGGILPNDLKDALQEMKEKSDE